MKKDIIKMGPNHDISRVTTNLVLVLPLSITRLSHGQSPREIYNFIKYFKAKCSSSSVDIIFLYTNSLYLNKDDSAFSVNGKTRLQMLNHSEELKNILLEDNSLVARSMHFLPWDYFILNALNFRNNISKLHKLYKEHAQFRAAVDIDIGTRPLNIFNISFILEECLITRYIREQLVMLRTTLAFPNAPRLIAYHGDPLWSDVYLYKSNLIPRNGQLEKRKIYNKAVYNIKEKKLIDYDSVSFDFSSVGLSDKTADI